MEHVSSAKLVPQGNTAQASNTGPLIIVTILFFMWGLLTSLNDVLIPHLKSVYTLTYVQSMMVQGAFFLAYFLVSIPAGVLIKKIGYKAGAVAGLVIAAAGCALFYPAATNGYYVFLVALFIMAGGITVLQVAANPYVTVLGDPATASSRLNLTQAFNSLGTTVGPWLGSTLILAGVVALSAEDIAKLPAVELLAHRAAEAASVQVPYLWLAGSLVALAVLFAFARLPKLAPENSTGGVNAGGETIMSKPHLVLGVMAIFLYVGGEVSIGSFLINFMGEKHIAGLGIEDAAKYVTFYWGGAMVGRFIGAAAMRTISPGKALAFNSAIVILLSVIASFTSGSLAMWAILAVGLFNSIMFPTIFSMAVHKLGGLTGQGSGLLCMAIAGGGVVPFIQGAVADAAGIQLSFLVPAACYAFILFYGIKYASLHKT